MWLWGQKSGFSHTAPTVLLLKTKRQGNPNVGRCNREIIRIPQSALSAAWIPPLVFFSGTWVIKAFQPCSLASSLAELQKGSCRLASSHPGPVTSPHACQGHGTELDFLGGLGWLLLLIMTQRGQVSTGWPLEAVKTHAAPSPNLEAFPPGRTYSGWISGPAAEATTS